MEVVNQAELAVNLFLQSLGPALQSIMGVITLLGSEIFYILFMPTIYWCVNAWAGLRIGVMLLSSVCFNGFSKCCSRDHAPIGSVTRSFLSRMRRLLASLPGMP